MLSTPPTPMIRKVAGGWRRPGKPAKQAILSYWMSVYPVQGRYRPGLRWSVQRLQVTRGKAMASAFDRQQITAAECILSGERADTRDIRKQD